MPPSTPPPSTLQTQATTLLALLGNLSQTLTSSTAATAAGGGGPAPLAPTSPQPLHLLRDATHLLKAQSTKLGLLLVTAPLTASAVAAVLAACGAEAVPGAAAAWAVLDAARAVWGEPLVAEVRAALLGLVGSFEALVRFCDGLEPARIREEKESVLAATGRVWEAADRVIKVVEEGFVGVVLRKATESGALVRDAVQELKAWGEEEEEDDEDAGDMDTAFGVKAMPPHREELRALLDETIRITRLVATLYQALIKRRLVLIPFKAPPYRDKERESTAMELARTVDGVLARLKAIPETVDEMAGAFYELDEDSARTLIDVVRREADAVAGQLALSWDGREDEFTSWVGKWRAAIAPKNEDSVPSANSIQTAAA